MSPPSSGLFCPLSLPEVRVTARMSAFRALFPRPCAAPPHRHMHRHAAAAIAPALPPPFADPGPAVASGSFFPRSRQPRLCPHWPPSPPPLLGATYSSCSGQRAPPSPDLGRGILFAAVATIMPRVGGTRHAGTEGLGDSGGGLGRQIRCPWGRIYGGRGLCATRSLLNQCTHGGCILIFSHKMVNQLLFLRYMSSIV